MKVAVLESEDKHVIRLVFVFVSSGRAVVMVSQKPCRKRNRKEWRLG